MFKRVNVEIAKYLVYILSIAAFVLLFFTPFGPIDEKFIPYHPIGWAGIFTYFAMILSFNRKFEETKDNFWLIVTAGFFPLLISDLYFFPIPTFYGFGMLEWAGLQFIVFSLGFIYYSQERILKYSNLAIVILSPLMTAAFLFGENTFLSPFKTLFLLVLIVAAFSLSYYTYRQRNYLFIVGTVLNFIIANAIVVLYFITGRIIFGWEHLLMAVVTDRIAIFGRVLMALSAILAHPHK
ncbi:MAG: hypothetical protein ACE5KD_04570 [Candidatus Bathyarchaeia archaeon]